jgi:hypothetical protein
VSTKVSAVSGPIPSTCLNRSVSGKCSSQIASSFRSYWRMRSVSEPTSAPGLARGLAKAPRGCAQALSVVEAPRRTLGQASPEGFDRSLGTWFTSCVRVLTSASRERIMARWAWEPSPLCLSGCKSFGCTLARRARSLNAWCELHGEDLSGRCPRIRVGLPTSPEGKGADSTCST